MQLLPDDSEGMPTALDQHPLAPPPVKLPVKDPLPGAKIEAAVGHRDHHFAAHALPLQLCQFSPVMGPVLFGHVNRTNFDYQEGMVPCHQNSKSVAPAHSYEQRWRRSLTP